MTDVVTAEDKAAAREILAMASAPGKHSTKNWAPYKSGHCGLGASEEAHKRCTGTYSGVYCRCVECHGERPKTEPRDQKEA